MKRLLKCLLFFNLLIYTSGISIANTTEESVTLNVGEYKTLSLPQYIKERNPYSVGFYTLAPNYVEVVSCTQNSVTLKGLQSFSTPVYVRCDYYYIKDGRAYSGGYNYSVTVTGGSSGGETAGSFQLNEHDITIKIGEIYKLTYTFKGTSAPVTWKVGGDPAKKIITIDDSGNVKGLSEGSTPVYATTSNGRYDTCYVTVCVNTVEPDSNLKDGDLISSTNTTVEGHDLYFSVLNSNNKSARTGYELGNTVFVTNGMRQVSTVTIPSNIKGFRVEEIGNSSLSGLNINIPFEIYLPYSIKNIRSGGFRSNDNLVRINIPDGVSLIPYKCFSDCSNLKDIILPGSIERVDAFAFENCKSVESLTFGEKIEYIDMLSLVNCTGIKEITIKNQCCPEVTDIAHSAYCIFHWAYNYEDYYDSVILRVPTDAVDTYRKDGDWGLFKNILPIGVSNVSEIDDNNTNFEIPIYFNLQGIKVEKPQNGIFIKVCGGKREKVIIE